MDTIMYETNGGTVVGIAGDDFAVIASDTRLSSGYSISTREQGKLFPISEKTVVGLCGCWNDVIALDGLLQQCVCDYKYLHHKVMSTECLAHMMSVMLYCKRFFPYAVTNIVAGLDQNGKGVVYRYDSIGHYESCNYVAEGSSGLLIKPVLDSLVGLKNMQDVEDEPPLTQERAVNIAADVFTCAAERDIYTGDSVVIKIITKDGIKDQKVMLRRD